MKRRFLALLLTVLLLLATFAVPVGASAAKSKVNILKVTVEGARVRKGPSSAYDVITSVSKGTKVFYAGKMKNSFAYICTDKGVVGYMYRGFLDSYGVAYKYQVYRAKGSAIVYKKASTSSKRVTRLTKSQHVIVYQVKGSWAYIKTLSGTGGYVKKSNLKKA